MAYGNVMKKGIPENSDLVFDVELLDCQKDELADVDISQLQSAVEESGSNTEIDDQSATTEWININLFKNFIRILHF